MADDRDDAAVKPADTTRPQWQPPGSATRSLTLSEIPAVEQLKRSQPVPQAQPAQAAPPALPQPVSGTRSVDTPLAYERTLSVAPEVKLEPSELQVGDTIGERYVVEQALSSGGFGAVYRAKDRQIPNHQVAIKLLHKPAASEEERESALRELTLIASVSHPSVVQFKDYGWQNGRLWFAMPLYKGQTLDQRYNDGVGHPQLTRKEARPLFERLARGLAAMHDVGIHHHDIKPENIFVADIAGFDGGLPVLLDLGIAAKRGEGPKGLTPEYAAPEVAAAVLGDRQRAIGGAADVFSLALVLRNFLEWETAPATGDEVVPLLNTRATEAIPPPKRRELRYLVPYFSRWLSLDPDERPTAEELASELAILTEPEERREARKRLLRRLVPIVLIAGLVVALLYMQVRKQKTEITVQKERLSQEMQESEALRQQSTDQLQKLEEQNEKIGSQGQRLTQAIKIARTLETQLGSSEREVDRLTLKTRKLTEERTTLQQQGDALRTERETLLATQARLSRERDDLIRTRDILENERTQLQSQRDGLERERDTAVTQRNDALRDKTALDMELATAKKALDTTKAERDATNKAYDDVRDEVQKLRDQVRDLREERDKLLALRRASQAADNAAPDAPEPKPKPRKRPIGAARAWE